VEDAQVTPRRRGVVVAARRAVEARQLDRGFERRQRRAQLVATLRSRVLSQRHVLLARVVGHQPQLAAV